MLTALRPPERRALRTGAMVFLCAAPFFLGAILARQPVTLGALFGALITTFVVVGMLGATVTTMMLLVASLHAGDADRPRRCARCDYDLTGATGDRCPECGSRADATEPRMMWKP